MGVVHGWIGWAATGSTDNNFLSEFWVQDDAVAEDDEAGQAKEREVGGPKGPEPTRYGDWERAGRCSDF